MTRAAKRTRLVLPIVAIGVIGIVAFRLFAKEPTLKQHAENVAVETIGQDADALSNRILKDELSKLGWSRDRAKAFLQAVVLTKYRGLRFEKVLNGGGSGWSTSGWCRYRVTTKSGDRFERWSHVDLSDEGAVVTLSALLQEAWLTEFLAAHPELRETDQARRAIKEGIVRDYEVLRRWAFRGFYYIDGQFVPLEKSHASAQKWLRANLAASRS